MHQKRTDRHRDSVRRPEKNLKEEGVKREEEVSYCWRTAGNPLSSGETVLLSATLRNGSGQEEERVDRKKKMERRMYGHLRSSPR